MKRTHLPLNALRVFDAAARHLSFTRAADELAVTPAAVGQQIRALEDVLGVILFRRTPKGLELTLEAEAGLGALRDGFLRFEEAVQAMQAGQASTALTIAAPRDFTARWLAPRLAAIAARDPDLRLTLVAADTPLDFTEANLDLAIRWGGDAEGLESIDLGSSDLVMIAPRDSEGRFAIVWSTIEQGDGDGRPVMRVGDAGLAIDAVCHGLGTALVPLLLVESDIAAGRVRIVGEPQQGSSYRLIAPTPQWRQKKVRALVIALSDGMAPPL
jgi:LysR family transcriptional regulator, glycine cleavage system transcriptional activator